MPKTSAPDRAWLSAEVPVDLAEQFRKRAADADRSATQHLRHLIRGEVSCSSEAPAATPGLREDASRRARGERE
jgi:hypothetical protein